METGVIRTWSARPGGGLPCVDLVGNSTPLIDKHKLSLKPVDRQDQMSLEQSD